MKGFVLILVLVLLNGCNNSNNYKYLSDNNNSLDVIPVPIVKENNDIGFFLAYNNQIYQTIYIKDLYDEEIDYHTFLIRLLKGEINLDNFLNNYNVEIIVHDSTIAKNIAYNDYLIKKGNCFNFKNDIPLSKQYNIIRILFNNSYQITFNDYSGEYCFKKVE